MCLAIPTPFVLGACAGQVASNATSQAAAPAQPTSAPATAVQLAPTQPAPTQPPPTEPAPTQSVATQPASTQAAQAPALQPTPACEDDDDLTPSQTEGPFFTPKSPERTSLREPGITGTNLVLTGQVLSTSCAPVARALVDFWHADDSGEYDNVGYRLRGHQFTDDQGRYVLETIVPGLYPGRTRHFHVKVQAPNQPILTTQLYFPGEPRNANDGIFQPELLMDVQNSADGKAATFNFVLAIS
jgi:protocatechuate 3,4-dioxygenase beta subunit